MTKLSLYFNKVCLNKHFLFVDEDIDKLELNLKYGMFSDARVLTVCMMQSEGFGVFICSEEMARTYKLQYEYPQRVELKEYIKVNFATTLKLYEFLSSLGTYNEIVNLIQLVIATWDN